MSCSGELRKLREEVEAGKDSDYKDGYLAALGDAMDIVEAHEEEE